MRLVMCADRTLLTFCIGICTWFPRISVNLILVWGLWSHLLAAHELGLVSEVISSVLGVFFAGSGFVAYSRVCSSGPGSPLEVEDLVGDEETGVPEAITKSVQTKYNGGFRYCSKCQCWKPDRCHHCSKCRRCVLRMDHHCPWFAECIGFSNYKYFVQFLWYVVGLCFTAQFTSIPILYDFFRAQRYHTEFLGINFVIYFMMAIVMGLCILGFAAYTTWILTGNSTTLERMERGLIRTSLPPSRFRYRSAPDTESVGNPFDINSQQNVEQVLGSRWIDWILPTRPALPQGINGVSWPINPTVLERAEAAAQAELAMHHRKREWDTRMQANLASETRSGDLPSPTV